MNSRAAADEAVISPLTREPLAPGVLIPNIALRQRIESHADDELRVAEAAAAAARAAGMAEGVEKGRAEGEEKERKRQAEAASSSSAEASAPKRARRR